MDAGRQSGGQLVPGGAYEEIDPGYGSGYGDEGDRLKKY